MKKKIQVIMLPTNEKSNLCGITELHYRGEEPQIDSLQNQAVYFLSNEEIKKDDINRNSNSYFNNLNGVYMPMGIWNLQIISIV